MHIYISRDVNLSSSEARPHLGPGVLTIKTSLTINRAPLEADRPGVRLPIGRSERESERERERDREREREIERGRERV